MSESHALVRVESLSLVAVGGFAGANLRYLFDSALPPLPATLLANVLGSFALGVLVYESLYADALAGESRAVLSTGFLSSLTTYSTFALQSVEADLPVLAANVLGTYALGFGAVLAGRAVARRLVGDPDGGGSA